MSDDSFHCIPIFELPPEVAMTSDPEGLRRREAASKALFAEGRRDLVDKILQENGQVLHRPKNLFESSGFATREVLSWLWGKPLDNLAIACVMMLEPLSIELSTGWVQTVAAPRRVVVFYDEKTKCITRITQAVSTFGGLGVHFCEAVRRRYGFSLNNVYSKERESK